MNIKFFILLSYMVGIFNLQGFAPIFPVESPPRKNPQSNQSEIILDEFRKILAVNKEYRVICQIATFTPDRQPVLKTYKLYIQNNRVLLTYLEPERDRGKMILMINDQLWQYFPKIQKTITINSSMLLSGNVNLTDIVGSTLFQLYNFTNYEFDSKEQNHILIFLAASNNSPYGKVKYYYANGKINYIEAYARSGIMLKKIVFTKYLTDNENQNHPAQIKIINTLFENDYSLIQMTSFTPMKVPNYYFNSSALDKVRE